jgi:transposase-like protein
MFPHEDACKAYLVAHRWPDGVACPRCGNVNVHPHARAFHWQCTACAEAGGYRFSVLVGTVFENTNIDLLRWFKVIHLMLTSKKGISALQVMRYMGFGSYKTAWYMCHRIRAAMVERDFQKLMGIVEVDETFVGGKLANMHKSKLAKLRETRKALYETGYMNKAIVMGMLDRKERRVRATVIPSVQRDVLQAEILKQISPCSKVYTDEAVGYDNLPAKIYAHEVVNHMQRYVDGKVHTNGIENFWSLLKRGLRGTYVAVEPFHLFRYVDEQVFRYNNRATKDNPLTDSDRFDLAVSQIVNKRLTYAELTGKVGGGPDV